MALLISRGLLSTDNARALDWLKRIGYYRLSAYFIPFRVPDTDTFQPGTTLDQIIDLYKFDCNLRLLVMQAMDRIEIAVRGAVTYHLAHDMGVFGYAAPQNFVPLYDDRGEVIFDHRRLTSSIAAEEKRSAELFVAHYRGKYTLEPYLPIWAATELVSFGILSRMFRSVADVPLKKKIAWEFGQPEVVFSSWLHVLSTVRNTCAHHSRLWNRELAVKPLYPKAWHRAGISNRRFYGVALIIQTLLDRVSPRSRWKERLKAHFNAHPSVDISHMHFPPNWQNRNPWL